MAPKKAKFKLTQSEPEFLEEARTLNARLKELDESALRKLMHISDNLAKEVYKKIRDWESSEGTYPAWLLFSGDVYKGLKAEELTAEDFAYAQEHVATLSGLYGIVRPLDAIKPYRLEAGYKLSLGDLKNLYVFWGDKIARTIPVEEKIVNLSSEEYIKLIRPFVEVDRIITPKFLQTRADGTKFEAIHAKIARGAMAHWIIRNRIEHTEDLRDFSEDGYTYMPDLSTEIEPVFMRDL
jgi:cytoplasmic iron level regulating protein YaaA (DUF328/UPF0246 family)